MKKFILSLLVLCGSALAATAQNTTIDLKLKGLPDGTKLSIELAGTYQDEPPIQTVEVKKGKAQFAFDVPVDPRGYNIAVPDNYGYFTIALSQGEKVQIQGKATITPSTSERNPKPTTSFTEVTVKGSPTNDKYYAIRIDRAAQNARYAKYHEEHKAVLDKLSGLQRGSEERKAIEATDEYKAFAQAEGDFFKSVQQDFQNAFNAAQGTWMQPFLMLTTFSYLTTENKKEYDQFTDDVKQSFYGKIVADKVLPMDTSEAMPDFTFTDHATGQKMSFREICKKSKYVLLDFWASWCGPCRKEIPNFKSQYELYHDKGLNVVSISADQKESDWLKALDEEKLAWPNDRDGKQGICNLYKVQFYPTVYLVDSDCKVIALNNDARGEKLRAKLAELFK